MNFRRPVNPRHNTLSHSRLNLIGPESRPEAALVLVAHCKALEARGPIASHSAGPPGPAALLLALEGQASSAVTRRLPACTSILTDTSTTNSGSMSVMNRRHVHG
jgi:hypothetical protein